MYDRSSTTGLPLRLRLAARADSVGLSRLLMSVRSWIPRRELTVVQYHRVAAPDDLGAGDSSLVDATPETFAEHLRFYRRYFTPISLEHIREMRAGGKPLPPNSLLVTFDDGYRDNRVRAMPILQQFGMRAVFFVSTNYLDQKRLFWWDRIALMIERATVPRLKIDYPMPQQWKLTDPISREQAVRGATRLVKNTFGMDLDLYLSELARACGLSWSAQEEAEAARAIIMSWDDARDLHRGGMDVQSHTRNHRVLQTIPDENLSDELLGARLDIEQKVGQTCDTIAYPVGRGIFEDPRLRGAVVTAGYALGFTNAPGLTPVDGSVDPYDWRRLRIDGDMPPAVVRGMAVFPQLGT